MEERGRRLTDAFVAALELREHLREGTDSTGLARYTNSGWIS